MPADSGGPISDLAGHLATAIGILTTVAVGAFSFWRKHRIDVENEPLRRSRRDDEISTNDAQRDLNESAKQIIETLRQQIKDLQAERDYEKRCGLEHYERCCRMYGLLGRIVAGEHTPDKLPRMEEL